jgi:hypothetical protein
MCLYIIDYEACNHLEGCIELRLMTYPPHGLWHAYARYKMYCFANLPLVAKYRLVKPCWVVTNGYVSSSILLLSRSSASSRILNVSISSLFMY